MKYSAEFDSKFGFGDGDSMPPDAHEVRTVELFAMNTLLAALGSGVRLVPLDRPGVHNCWLWSRCPAKTVDQIIQRVGLWNFCLGEWNSPMPFKIPEPCWGEDCPLGADENAWWLAWAACTGDGTIPGCDEDIGYLFVNARNQIRKKDLMQWVARASKAVVAEAKEAASGKSTA